MEASQKAYNISVGELKNAYCWSLNVFCSSITCCCSQRGCFWCCKDKRCCSCRKDDNEEEGRPILDLSPMVTTANDIEITDFKPYYNMILEKSDKVDFHDFLKLHQKYSDTPSYMSHTIHCQNKTCIAKRHLDYEKWCGLALEPFVYYLALDWSYLRNHSPDSDKELFRRLFRDQLPFDDDLNKEWEYMKRKLEFNVFVTLINFPIDYEEILSDSNEGRNLLQVVNLYKCLKIRVGNIVKR